MFSLVTSFVKKFQISSEKAVVSGVNGVGYEGDSHQRQWKTVSQCRGLTEVRLSHQWTQVQWSRD